MGPTEKILSVMLSKELAKETAQFDRLSVDHLKRDHAIKIFTDIRKLYKELGIAQKTG